MISFCIATYNFNVSHLVDKIDKQCLNIGIESEIIILDDCSIDSYPIDNTDRVKYHMNEVNLGRSKTRNKLIGLSKFSKIVFIDGDSDIEADFVRTYHDNISNEQIICGGTKYIDIQPQDLFLLRWKYGIKREQIDSSFRNKNPFESLSFNNVMIHKYLLKEFVFDETLSEYGHEDTLLAFQFQISEISIKHIDNPVIHLGIDRNEIFVDKTEKGIINLINIKNKFPEIESFVKILRVHSKFKKYNSTFILKFISFVGIGFIKKKALKSSLFYFDLYKLLFLNKKM